MKSILAFDPGKSGGWALLNGNKLIEWGRMPVTKTKPPKYDYLAISELFLGFEPELCVIEGVNAHACKSKSSAFSLGGCYEMLQCLAVIHATPIVFANPTAWTRAMVSGAKKKDKAMHMLDAERLFPECREDMKIKNNDGIADAILMAEWARRSNL